MYAFVRCLATGSCTHPERLAFRVLYVTWPLALGLIRNVLRSRYCTSFSHWLLDSSGTACVPGIVRYFAIGSWTHPERLAFRVLYVTWPLALGLIRSFLHSGYCTSLGNWLLDSSGATCIPGNVRHLAIGSWTHSECKELVGIKVA
ncbi:hypothetical protein Tco_0705653 [Tanacetum coccineum]|uniref:Uncharacterized protein n=1 Tax=Tanacetum coccineum TaxID=301880 RepID=A0ABQ4Y636_9ASTR